MMADNPRARILIVSLCMVLLSACSQIPYYWGSSSEHIDHLLEQQKYYEALNIIAKLSSDDPDHQQLQKRRPDIVKASNNYAAKTSKKAKQLANKKQWAQAIKLIDDSLEKIPHSEPLRTRLRVLLAWTSTIATAPR